MQVINKYYSFVTVIMKSDKIEEMSMLQSKKTQKTFPC